MKRLNSKSGCAVEVTLSVMGRTPAMPLAMQHPRMPKYWPSEYAGSDDCTCDAYDGHDGNRRAIVLELSWQRLCCFQS